MPLASAAGDDGNRSGLGHGTLLKGTQDQGIWCFPNIFKLEWAGENAIFQT